MARTVKVLVSLTEELLSKLDEVIKRGEYASRSEAVREALRKFLEGK